MRMYIYVNVYVYIYMHMYLYTYIYMHVYMYICEGSRKSSVYNSDGVEVETYVPYVPGEVKNSQEGI
jgi:hypothetical protein